MLLKVTNLQPVPSRIEDFGVETGSPDGGWTELQVLPIPAGKLYELSSSLKGAVRWDVSKYDLEKSL